MSDQKKCPSCSLDSMNTNTIELGTWTFIVAGGTYDNPSTLYDVYRREETIQNTCQCRYKSKPYTCIRTIEVQGGEEPRKCSDIRKMRHNNRNQAADFYLNKGWVVPSILPIIIIGLLYY